MPQHPPQTPEKPAAPRRGFRERYDELEQRRAALVARLAALDASRQQHPGYKRARKLLNDTFRKAKLGQRLAVLHAASWLIDVLERLTTIT
jgi:hypothetical protein